MFKIMMINSQGIEYVDEFSTRETAEAMIAEYRMAFGSACFLSILEAPND